MAQFLLCGRNCDSTATLRVNWASIYIKHNPELRTRYSRRTSYQRAEQEDSRVIKEGLDAVWAAIIECIGSSGCHTPPLIILKEKEHQATVVGS